MNISESEMLTALMNHVSNFAEIVDVRCLMTIEAFRAFHTLTEAVAEFRAERIRGRFRADDFKKFADNVFGNDASLAPGPAQSTHERNRDRSEEELVAARAQLEEAMRHAAQTLAKFKS